MTGKTKSGFQYSIPDGLKSDFRYVRALRELRSGKAERELDASVDMISIVLGSDAEVDRLMEHLADEHGRVSVKAVFDEIGEIIHAAGEKDKAVKN